MFIDFEKDSDSRWYAVLPTWTGAREDLEMVCGADIMLNIISQGSYDGSVSLFLSADEICDYDFILHKEMDTPDIGGATYSLKGLIFGIHYEFDIWLCDVTNHVFSCLPTDIYVRI